jgi:hypothetical protein
MNYKLSEIKKDLEFVKSKAVASDLIEKFDLDLVNLFELISQKEILIPISIFNDKLSALETISRYLHQNLQMSFKKIGELMNRSEKTIWQAHNHSLKKFQRRLRVGETKYVIPVSAFSDRQFSNLETIVKFMKEKYFLKYSEIGALLHRDQRTIWTVYNRASKKKNKI